MSSQRYSELKELTLAFAECARERQELSALNAELLSLVYDFMHRMESFGNWDDGCFYYNGAAASELQRPIEIAQEVIAKAEKLK